MVSDWMVRLLLVEYLVITVTCICERRWVAVLYWVGAMVLNVGVYLWMRGFK